ncbi:response regulator aspartate phosphatase H [Acrasis kona]|uniref:Response regulator aspartate phosphatase H n=1 Tax=Acrasis kona TaxID=1008807 RepID=A0AAW2Z7A1_9EUKA
MIRTCLLRTGIINLPYRQVPILATNCARNFAVKLDIQGAKNLIKDGYTAQEKKDFPTCLSYFEGGVAILEKSKDPKDQMMLAVTYNNLAEVLRELEKSRISVNQKNRKYGFVDIKKLLSKAEGILRQVKPADKIEEEEITLVLAGFLNTQGLYQFENVKNYTLAQQIFSNNSEAIDQATTKSYNKELIYLELLLLGIKTKHNIAQCQLIRNLPAYDTFKDATHAFDKLTNLYPVNALYHKMNLTMLNSMGLIKLNEKEYEAALEHFKTALSLISGEIKKGQEQPNLQTIALSELGATLNNIATAHFKMKDLQTSEMYFRQALYIYENTPVGLIRIQSLV